MRAERFRFDVSTDVLQVLRDTVVIRKVDIDTCLRNAQARLERARAEKDDEFAVMAEAAVIELQDKLIALEGARHAVFSARSSSDIRIARIAARRRPR